jgi:hypothetical protein
MMSRLVKIRCQSRDGVIDERLQFSIIFKKLRASPFPKYAWKSQSKVRFLQRSDTPRNVTKVTGESVID